MAAPEKLTVTEQQRKKIIQKMTGQTIKASKQKLGVIRLVSVSYEPVKDAETAFREANAARKAKAIYDRVVNSGDVVEVTSLLTNPAFKVDSGAGALLVELAWQAARMKKQRVKVDEKNKEKSHDCSARDIQWCKTADGLHIKNRSKSNMARIVQKALVKQGTKPPSLIIIKRAFARQKYS
jgi:hypothetical protein